MGTRDSGILIVLFFLLHNFQFSSPQHSNWTPKNVRGYLYYPNFGPWDYSRRQLEVIFDYDSIKIPPMALAHVECYGYKNCTKTKSNEICANSDWAGNKSIVIKPYQDIIFDTPLKLDRYSCRVRISDQGMINFGSWSDLGWIELSFDGSVINPKPSIMVCQALKNPPENYGRSHLIRAIDIDAANTPNETAVQNFDLNCNLAYNGQGMGASYQTVLCFDWVANWQYRLNTTNRNCMVKVDTLYMKPEIYVDCFDSQILHLQCYSPLSLLFFTTNQPSSSKNYRLFEYDMKTGHSRVIVSEDNSVVSETCAIPLSHFWLCLDWRQYWNGDMISQAKLVFISGLDLWTYDILSGQCEKMMGLKNIGVDLPYLEISALPDQILQFDMDWSYFYWINGSQYDIRAFSWKTKDLKIFEKLRIFNAESQEQAHNLSSPIYEDMKFMVSLLKYTPAARPYPFLMDCLIPDLRVTVTITNVTNAIVTVDKVWNTSDICLKTNRPPPQLKLWCSSNGNLSTCGIGVGMYRGRDERYTTELKKLVKGQHYNVTIETSIIGNEEYCKTTIQTFVAEMPQLPDMTWERNLAIGLAVSFVVITASLVSLYFGWYRHRKAMHDFLRRERIDASELSLIKVIGQGEFGEVWLANYSPSDHRKRVSHKTGTIVEVALKMRKSNEFNYRSTLLSADCFFQEAVALNFLRHPNIILAYGLCMNFKQLPPILVLEYMNGGNCIDFVKSQRRQLSNADMARICRDLIRACLHLTNMHVVHKDIAARNVLVKKNIHGKPEIAKLTDFGLARDVGKPESVYASTNKEVLFHIHSTAPEGFEGRFSTQSDVWSFGIFVWELFSLLESDHPIPYSNLGTPTKQGVLAFLKSGQTLDNPKWAPADVCMLMRQCWALEPNERQTFRQLNAGWRLIGNQKMTDTRNREPLLCAHFDMEEPENACTNAGYAMLDGQPSPEMTRATIHIVQEDHCNGYTPRDMSEKTSKNGYRPWQESGDEKEIETGYTILEGQLEKAETKDEESAINLEDYLDGYGIRKSS